MGRVLHGLLGDLLGPCGHGGDAVNLTPPPPVPVKWRCSGVVVSGNGRVASRTSCEVEARFWYDAREMGERILGLPRGEVEAVLLKANGNGRQA